VNQEIDVVCKVIKVSDVVGVQRLMEECSRNAMLQYGMVVVVSI